MDYHEYDRQLRLEEAVSQARSGEEALRWLEQHRVLGDYPTSYPGSLLQNISYTVNTLRPVMHPSREQALYGPGSTEAKRVGWAILNLPWSHGDKLVIRRHARAGNIPGIRG